MGVIVHMITPGMSACDPHREKRPRLCAWAERVSTGLGCPLRPEPPDDVPMSSRRKAPDAPPGSAVSRDEADVSDWASALVWRRTMPPTAMGDGAGVGVGVGVGVAETWNRYTAPG